MISFKPGGTGKRTVCPRPAQTPHVQRPLAGAQLKACNNVILVDIWWNPALGDQAFDRAHQTRVSTYKLTIENTVEERILTLEDSKRALATAALGGDKIKNLKLGQALMALFRSGRGDDDN